MKTTALFAAIALTATLLPAGAQQPGRATTEKDINTMSKPILPPPDSNRILVPFGDTARVYFKSSFKSIRMSDTDVVRARPESDHIIEFTALSPGTSHFDLEANDGGATASGEVIVVREAHEVKVYVPSGAKAEAQKANVIINQGDNNTQESKRSAEAEYSTRLCNEVGCRPVLEGR